MRHCLKSIDEEFLEDGVRAFCICGWKSSKYRDDQEALKAHREHRRIIALNKSSAVSKELKP